MQDTEINHNLTPPRDAALVEIHANGLPVFKERRVRQKQVQVRDPETKAPMFHRHPQTGAIIKPVTELVEDGVEEREFQILALGNNMTVKNYDFRGTEAEARTAQVQEEARPERVLEELRVLRAAMERAGIDANDLEQVRAEMAGAGAEG